jgi:ABC-2 type transport system permease protein
MRLLCLYARMDVLWIARARSSAFTFYLAEWVLGAGVVASTWLLAERFDGLGPWSRSQVVFLLGYSLLVRGVVDMSFGWNVAHISRRIGRGQLDHMLLQPVPLWVLMLSEGFSPLSGSGLALSGGVVLWLSGEGFGSFTAPLFVLNLVASVSIVVAFSYAWGSLAFLAPRAAEEINSSTMDLVDQVRAFPLDGLAPGLVGVLLSVVPIGFVAWLPARSLLGLGDATALVLATPLSAIVIVAIAAFIFTRGMRHYRATGSTRYLSLGHRR